MKKVFMILILIISFMFVTGCNKEEAIKTYDDVEFIEKQEEKEDVEEDFEEYYEALEYRHLSNHELGIMFTFIEEDGSYYLHIVASKLTSDDIVWEYKTSQYEVSMHKQGQYASEPNSDEIIYIFESEYITALDLVTGEVLWQNKEKYAVSLNDGIVINDTLYAKVPWENKIYAFNKKTGKKIKELSLPESEEYVQYNIIGSYNNNIIIQCMAENGEFIQLNPNNNSISTMNIYLTD